MKKILFICTENAGRSQIAEALFNSLKSSDEWLAESSGTIPAKEIYPMVIDILAKSGVQIRGKVPQLFNPTMINDYTRIISFGCLVKELFSKDVQSKIEEWEITDPKDRTMEEVRVIQNEIYEKVVDLLHGMTPKNGKLIIVRHHESEWNRLGKWTGSKDVHLTEYGKQKSFEMGLLIKDIHIDQAFDSTQVRSLETLTAMLEAMGQTDVPIQQSSAHNERDYGEYTGKNKWEMKEVFGEEKFNCIRREWNCPVPSGETLKMVYERVVPFYMNTILPLLRSGKNILLVSHGNAIRALMKYIESIPDDGVKNIEMMFGVVSIYSVDKEGKMINNEKRMVESKVNA